MREKQNQIIKMGKNNNIGKGADAILYNLAFSPKITYIDFSEDVLNSPDSAEAIYKLVKISRSLETLILKNTQINNNLKKEFFIALGENNALTHLNINHITHLLPVEVMREINCCGIIYILSNIIFTTLS